jgi:probable poly-beta-1,6-N-acetyl-D-glucosamine export protein
MSLPMFLVIPVIIGTKSLDSWHFTHFRQPLQKIVLGFLTGSTSLSYWYIPFICVVYCCFPIFVLMNKFPKLYFLLIPLLCVATIAGRPVINNNPLHSFVYFLPSYLIGIISARYSHTIRYRNGKIIGFLSLIISIFLVLPQILFSTEHSNNYIVEIIANAQVFDANLFQKIFLAFFLFYNLPTKINVVNFLLAKLADASFAIFFIFDYIHIGTCYLLKISKVDLLIIPSIGMCLIYFLFVIVFSYSIAVCIKQISAKYSRFIIGW